MNKRDQERIAHMLIEIAKEVKEFLSSDENQAYPAYRSDSLLISSFDEEREEILVNLLNDQEYTAKFSEEYLEKLLKEKVRAMMHNLRQQEQLGVRPQKIARETAESIFNELDNYTTNVTVYLPVSGINLRLEEGKLEIGNITLQKMTQEKSDELQSYITSAIMEGSHTPEKKQALVQYFVEDLQRILKEKDQPVYAIYHVIAEPIQAEKRAREECYKVFDLLRYTLPMLSNHYPMRFSIPKKYIDNNEVEVDKYARREKKAQMEAGKSISFGLESEIGTHTDIISDIIILRDSTGFNLKSSRKEQPRSLAINAHTIEGLKMAKVFEASEILKKEDASQTNFERCILRSIHWFANAQTPMQPEYVLLSLMSSIEAFLNPPGDHTKVTIAIIEGAAALGGRQGHTYTKKRIEKLYDKRSALSHGDHTEIMERDISELRAIAFYLIHQMLQRTDEFTTQEQLYEVVEKIREEIKQGSTKTDSTNNPQEEVD
jgi:Apea-like HEPN